MAYNLRSRNFKSAKEASVEDLSWLPCDWKLVYIACDSKATACLDRYYYDPNGEHRFRSKKEVEYFIQTGKKKSGSGTKRKKCEATADPSESSAGEKKSGSGSKSGPLLEFGWDDVPEATTWKLTDPENDVWTPYIDGKMVDPLVKKQWDAAFEFLSSGNNLPM